MRYWIFIFSLVVLAGCAKVQNLDELLTLKAVADEQTRLAQYVDEQDRKFDLMVAEAKAGTLDSYSNQRKIQRTFGDPVYVAQDNREGQDVETWLYRYATKYFDADKIYLYFDEDGNLISSEYREFKHGEVREETTQEN